MNIVSIKQSRVPDRVYIKFSNHLYLPFLIDDVIILGLKSNQEVDSDLLTKIIETSLKYLSKYYALRQLSISPKTEKVLVQKLKSYINRQISKYKIPLNNISVNQVIESTIEYIKEKKLIDISDYVQYFINKNKNKSKREIIYLLERNGIDTKTISPELFNQDKPKIMTLLSRKKIKLTDLKDFKMKQKIMASLVRKGFSLTDIMAVIDEITNSR